METKLTQLAENAKKKLVQRKEELDAEKSKLEKYRKELEERERKVNERERAVEEREKEERENCLRTLNYFKPTNEHESPSSPLFEVYKQIIM